MVAFPTPLPTLPMLETRFFQVPARVSAPGFRRPLLLLYIGITHSFGEPPDSFRSEEVMVI